MIRRALVVATVVGTVLVTPAWAGVPLIDYTLDGTAGQNGWYVSNVTVAWTVNWNGSTPISSTGCEFAVLVSGDTTPTGTTRQCSATNAAGTSTATTSAFRIDTTKPTVTGASAARGADHNGWYNRSVGISWQGSDASSGVASCSSITYTGPDSANAAPTGTCRDQAGNVSASSAFALKYDATPPVVTGATPDRQPDQNGWYVKPVSFVFSGSDATSGLAGCDTVGYSGPDSGSASVTGACHDKAGNAGILAVPLAYDATPPSFVAADAAAYDSAVTLTWRAAGDPTKILVTRTPGSGTLVFGGSETRLDDKGLQNGVQYSYALTAVDAAGNTAQRSLVATPNAAAGPQPAVVATTTPASATTTATPSPTPGVATRKASATNLVGPRFGARLRQPPLLRWKAVAKTRYYNVQLWRNGHKILSLHPRRAKLQLRRSWTYRGKRYRLTPATYEWFVWPGVGTPTARKFGPMLGASRFTVIARA